MATLESLYCTHDRARLSSKPNLELRIPEVWPLCASSKVHAVLHPQVANAHPPAECLRSCSLWAGAFLASSASTSL